LEEEELGMANLNKVFLLGRLTRDPEKRYTTSGACVTEMGLATNRTWMKDGQKQEETTFVEVACWGRTAENCAEYLSKGRPVLIEGRLTFQSWETKEGGRRSKLFVTADFVQFLGSKDEGGGGGERRTQQDAQRGEPRAPETQQAPPDDDFNLEDIPF
jgi:single-strand DNA-binding protein